MKYRFDFLQNELISSVMIRDIYFILFVFINRIFLSLQTEKETHEYLYTYVLGHFGFSFFSGNIVCVCVR